ncbi:MAG: hypothetical protein ACYDHT_01545 [Solirubrobacteraceae bacterium]
MLFVVDQTGSASAHQQAELNQETTTTQQTQKTGRWKTGSSGSARKTVDEAAEAVTSPFTFATEATSSEWLSRAIALALTLIVYGFGLAFVARVIRVRV